MAKEKKITAFIHLKTNLEKPKYRYSEWPQPPIYTALRNKELEFKDRVRNGKVNLFFLRKDDEEAYNYYADRAVLSVKYTGLKETPCCVSHNVGAFGSTPTYYSGLWMNYMELKEIIDPVSLTIEITPSEELTLRDVDILFEEMQEDGNKVVFCVQTENHAKPNNLDQTTVHTMYQKEKWDDSICTPF